MPFSFAPAVWLVIFSIVLGAVYFVFDAVGDRREAKVHARYAAAANLTNEDVGKFNTDDEKVSAVREALVAKALTEAGKVEGQCTATPAQAKAITDIRRSGR